MLKNNILSQEADFDLGDIFEYTAEFGINQAIKYLSEIEEIFFKITLTPEIGKIRNEIKIGLYSFPVGEHIIFYRILTDHIRIVRVLHSGRDLQKHIK